MITKYMLLILKLYIEYMVHSFWQLNYPLIYLSSVYETESLPLPSPPHITLSSTALCLNWTPEADQRLKTSRSSKIFRVPWLFLFDTLQEISNSFYEISKWFIRSLFGKKQSSVHCVLFFFSPLSAIHKLFCPLRDFSYFAHPLP